jgi:aryl-alcohol dehydrogenase-like predicted oxidoreductase
VIGDTTVSAVGVGDVSLATADARGIYAGDVERALHVALEAGITFVECADEPDAERVVGAALRTLRMRDTVVVATHVAAPLQALQERVEASLRATRLDVLPLVLVEMQRAWYGAREWPEFAGALARLEREGKVQRWGMQWSRVDQWHADPDAPPPPPPPTSGLLVVGSLDGLPPFSADAMAALAEFSPSEPPAPPADPSAPQPAPPFVAAAVACSACTAWPELPAGTMLLARAPLAGGALAGRLGPGGKLALRDDRRSLSDDALDRIALGMARLAPLVRHEPPPARATEAARGECERGVRPDDVEAATVAELALRYVIDAGAIALPRLHRAEHVAEAIAAAAAPPLSAELRERIVAILQDR